MPVFERDIVTKELISIVDRSAGMSISDQLWHLIEEDRASEEKQEMFDGDRYYRSKHDILDKERIYYTADKQEAVDETKINHQLVNNYLSLLIDQKIHYLLSSPPSWTVESEVDREILQDILNRRFWKILRKYVKNASKHGQAFLYPYIDDKNGGFRVRVMDARELILIRDPDFEDELQQVIRYYEIEHISLDQSGAAETEVRLVVEWYTVQGIWFFEEIAGGELVLNSSRHPNGQIVPYLQDGFVSSEGFVVTQTGHWNRLPFIELLNNEEREPDLNRIRSLQDAYNRSESEFLDLQSDISEIIKVVRGSPDDNAVRLAENLRYFRVVGVTGDGGIDAITIDIPYRAKRETLNRLRDDIYAFGQGVDMTTDRFGNSPSGVALEFLYEPLEEKANDLIISLGVALEEYVDFYGQFLKFSRGIDFSPRIEFSFVKSMISNTSEKIEDVQKSKDILSPETYLSHHPFVKDVKLELERLDLIRSTAETATEAGKTST